MSSKQVKRKIGETIKRLRSVPSWSLAYADAQATLRHLRDVLYGIEKYEWRSRTGGL